MKVKGYQSPAPIKSDVKIQPAVQYEDRFVTLAGEESMVKIDREMVSVQGVCQICFTDKTIEADPLKKCPRCSTVVCDVCTNWGKTQKRIYPCPRPKAKTKKQRQQQYYQIDHHARCPTCSMTLYDYLAYHFRKEIW